MRETSDAVDVPAVLADHPPDCSEVGGPEGASEDGHDHAARPGRVVAQALLDGEPVAQAGGGAGEAVLEPVEIIRQRAQQQRDRHLAAHDDLLEVEHLGPQPGDGAHEGVRDAGPVGTREGGGECLQVCHAVIFSSLLDP